MYGSRATTGWKTGRKKAIITFHQQNPLEGYRRLTFMMLDADLVAVSPSSVLPGAGQAGLLDTGSGSVKKGYGFVQPLAPHEHWHVDVSYLIFAAFLLSMQRPGWLQPLHRALGNPRANERG